MKALTSSHFFPMSNPIQNYIWGSTTSIKQLFNIENPEQLPQAEMWMGAHPNGCSTVTVKAQSVLLSELIKQDKNAFLSAITAETFGELPYLFKVLAAENALSIQVHPSKAQALSGFEKEQKQGVAINAFNRNYKDNNHKPELVYALTSYQAMNGFRLFSECIELFKKMNLKHLNRLVSRFEQQPNSIGLAAFFEGILCLQGESKTQAIDELLCYVKNNIDDPLFSLIDVLALQYPNDIGLFGPLMLNVITLQPGQAMFLAACTPHAYIKGTALEIMANSDNVLRAGLTPKYMDVKELVSCTDFKETPFETLLINGEQAQGGVNFPIPVGDFKFSIYEKVEHLALTTSSAEILFAIEGEAQLQHVSGECITINKGESVFVPAYVGQYKLSCTGKVARAAN